MGEWTKVRWTQARQVTRLMGIKDREAPPEAVAPEAYCGDLKTAGDLARAVAFVGHALPRYESVAWAAEQVAAIRGKTPLAPAEAAVADAVAAWLADPDDRRRRAAFAAGATLDESGPEQMLSLAVWYSGGSIAPEGNPPVLPPPEACGRCAAGAVQIAAIAAGDDKAALAAALAAGEAVAAGTPRIAA